ncbi:polyketide synthase [Fusarium avenaceum]|nr:polyketide synthase [Fusarium avenaceum]
MGTDKASVYIVGLGHHYPPYINGFEDIEEYLAKFCDTKTPAVRKLLQVNQNTGIKGRPNIISRDDPLFNRSEPPTISELDSVFRTRAVDLAARACKKAIAEWKGKVSQITHTVAATGTNAGSPGYDLLVNERLGIRAEAQRMLLSGIGCAGGLATIRTAATIANDATLRGRPACVLGFICDVTSTNIRCDLKMISENPEEVRASMALFSDASAAFVICNSLGLKINKNAVYTVLDWENSVIPGTRSEENCLVDPLGKY